MQYLSNYSSFLGDMLLMADEKGLCGLWFEGQKYYAAGLKTQHKVKEIPLFKDVKRWLDMYFEGKEPDFSVPLHLTGTKFQNKVWEILLTIPYGHTISYGKIGEKLAEERGLEHISAQAVGVAVAHNKISVIIPCHRVIGSDGSLKGYAAGISRKLSLLNKEIKNS